MSKSIISCIVCFILHLSVNGQSYDPSRIKIVWKDSKDIPFMLFKNVQKEYPNAIFMTSAGKSTKSHHPIGLYVEKGKRLSGMYPISNPKTSTELTPLGTFVIKKGKAYISTSLNQQDYKDVDYALQANPMLVSEGKINKQLPKGKAIIRNGVGIKRDGNVYFACLKMGYREFAEHFIQQDCISALHLSDEKPECWFPDSKPSYSRYATIFVVE